MTPLEFLASLKKNKLDMNEAITMFYLYEDKKGVKSRSNLNKITCISSFSLTGLVNRLEVQGYVREYPPLKIDKRIRPIGLTDQGKQIVNRVISGKSKK